MALASSGLDLQGAAAVLCPYSALWTILWCPDWATPAIALDGYGAGVAAADAPLPTGTVSGVPASWTVMRVPLKVAIPS